MLTRAQVVDALSGDEPNYAAATRLGPEALPHLAAMVAEDDPLMAPRAASLAGMIGGPDAVAVIDRAAQSARPGTRVAAAAALRSLPPDLAAPTIPRALADADPGVRKQALRAMEAAGLRNDPRLRERLAEISRTDPEPALRDAALRMIQGH